MYYRVAIQVDASPTWKWKSTALSSLNILLQWMQYYRMLPLGRLRIFSSRSQEDLNEQLVRENQGLGSPSVMAAQFLRERMIRPPEGRGEMSKSEESADHHGSPSLTGAIVARNRPVANETSRLGYAAHEEGSSALESRRAELELGPGGDHNLPYRFAFPTELPQVKAWMKLRERVQQGELHP